MKKKKCIICIIAVAILLCGTIVFAEGLSIKNQLIDARLAVNMYENDLNNEAVTKTQAQIVIYEENLKRAQEAKAAAEASGDILAVIQAESMIAECTSNINKANESMAEATLQAALSAFYKTYETQIASKQKMELSFADYTACTNIQIIEHNKHYINALVAELEGKVNIEKAKLKLGYTIQATVTEAEVQLNSAKLQLDGANAEQTFLRESLALNGASENAFTINTEPLFLKDDYFASFISLSLQQKQFESQIQAYEAFAIASNISETAKKKAELQLNIQRLEKQLYETNLQIYIKQIVLKHDNTMRQITALDGEIALAQIKVKNNEQLLLKGKTTEIKVTELKTQEQKLKAERMTLVFNANKIWYLLENCIENQSV